MYSGATVYYPNVQLAEGRSICENIGSLPSVVIIPGMANPQSSIAEWGPFYANHGFVAMTIGSVGMRDLPHARKDALLAALETLRCENVRPGSPLQGRLDLTRTAVSGWSLGG